MQNKCRAKGYITVVLSLTIVCSSRPAGVFLYYLTLPKHTTSTFLFCSVYFFVFCLTDTKAEKHSHNVASIPGRCLHPSFPRLRPFSWFPFVRLQTWCDFCRWLSLLIPFATMQFLVA